MKIIWLAFALFGISAAQDCDVDEIACANYDMCIPHTFLCDMDEDCDDESDEDYELCDALTSPECGVGEAMCERNGRSSCVSVISYCSMMDPPCQGDFDRRICQMLEGGVIAALGNFTVDEPIMEDNLNKSREKGENFVSIVPYTLQHPSCPPMYTMVDDYCLSLFHVGSMSWSESRQFCKFLGGDLVTFSDISQYHAVVQHLQKHGITSSFWIGGVMANAEEGWTWIDGSPMPMGSPFWAARYQESCVERNVTIGEYCFRYKQAPMDGSMGQCVGLSFEHFFYMADEDCVKRMSPLCAYMGVEEFILDSVMTDGEE